ncbi:MAG TPA: hypothetical protein PLR41_08095 [Alphaproteobacteria bacterium]|nr:hypothetical protein [Alphaproteobacteria bacterium]
MSCSTAPKTDTLEAKAEAGDPVAVCRLVARDIHACFLEKREMEERGAEEQLACYDTMMDDRKKGYLAAAKSKMKANSERGEIIFSLLEARMNLIAVTLPMTSAADPFEHTGELEQDCQDLAKFID